MIEENNNASDTVDNSVKVYIPKKKNINFIGEWVIVLGPLAYGIVVPGASKKVKITYNIDPDMVIAEHNDEVSPTELPKKVYEMFIKKVFADIGRIDNMMSNLISNKQFLNKFVVFAEDSQGGGTDEMGDVGEYTEEDAKKDAQVEELELIRQQREHQKRVSKSRAKPTKKKKKK